MKTHNNTPADRLRRRLSFSAMLFNVLNFLKTIAIIAVFPILIVLLPIWLLIFGNKSEVSPAQVMSYLKRMQAGEIDDYWWDDFINVPINDSELDSIRERCEQIWNPKSEFLSRRSEQDEFYLNELGLSEIRILIQRCERAASNK